MKYTPLFDARWADKNTRHMIINGKRALQHLRKLYREKTGYNLTVQTLVDAVVACSSEDARNLVAQVFSYS